MLKVHIAGQDRYTPYPTELQCLDRGVKGDTREEGEEWGGKLKDSQATLRFKNSEDSSLRLYNSHARMTEGSETEAGEEEKGTEKGRGVRLG